MPDNSLETGAQKRLRRARTLDIKSGQGGILFPHTKKNWVLMSVDVR